MGFPNLDLLFSQIEKQLVKASVSDIRKAALIISERYRRLQLQEEFRLHHEIERLAYIAIRMPATVAVITRVLEEIQCDAPMTLLDVGSGPGSVFWAASSLNITKAFAIEHEKGWIDIARKLWQEDQKPPFSVEWSLGDLLKVQFPQNDIVVASYCLNELPESSLDNVLEKLWNSTGRYFVWIEPGSKSSFDKMSKWRDRVIHSQKAQVIAPCQSSKACPYLDSSRLNENAPGWCHFSVRLERPAFHRLIKDVKLSYEDEKFCYLIVEKMGVGHVVEPSSSVDQGKLRLMNDPQLRKGHVRLIGCNSNCDIQEAVVSKKHKCYREARTASWGDLVVLDE